MARERIMQLDGSLGAAASAADRSRDLRALARHREAIAAKLSREREVYARRAARGDGKAAVLAVRAGEAQAAAEVLALNAGLQAELAALIAQGHRKGDTASVGVLEVAFDALADQSEAIAPSDGSMVGFGLSGAWVLQPDGKYVWDETATSQIATEYTQQAAARVAQGAPATGLLPPGVTETVDLAAQRAAQDAAIQAYRECRYDVIEDLNSRDMQEWKDAAARAESAASGASAINAGNAIRRGYQPFRIMGDCWETWDESTRRHRVYVPEASPLEKLPQAVADGWEAIGDAAQAAANLACQIASNEIVQKAADKIGAGATKAIGKAAKYGCGSSSEAPDDEEAPPPKVGAGVIGVGLLALLAAVL